MMRLVYSEQTLADLAEIFDYVASASPGAAERLADELLQVCELISANPGVGSRQESISSGLRRLTHQGYGIYYRTADDAVRIVRIVHHSRDLRSISW